MSISRKLAALYLKHIIDTHWSKEVSESVLLCRQLLIDKANATKSGAFVFDQYLDLLLEMIENNELPQSVIDDIVEFSIRNL
jgi:hypothetical protein